MVNRASGWSPFSGLRLHGHTVKSADRRRELSFQYNLRCFFLSLGCVCRSMELPSYILKGLLRNPPVCAFFFFYPPFPIYIGVSVSPFLPSASACISVRSTFAFYCSLSVSLACTSMRGAFLSHTTFLRIFPSLNIFGFCFFVWIYTPESISQSLCLLTSALLCFPHTLPPPPCYKCLFQGTSLFFFSLLTLKSCQEITLFLSDLISLLSLHYYGPNFTLNDYSINIPQLL